MVTQQNAATSEELSTNAVELSAQAEQLQEIISFFKIGQPEHDFRTCRKQPNNPQTQSGIFRLMLKEVLLLSWMSQIVRTMSLNGFNR